MAVSTRKRLFKIEIVYFKPSGKMYSSESFKHKYTDCGNDDDDDHHVCYMHDVADYVKELNKLKCLPGLSGGWEGPIYIDCDEGYPVLLLEGNNGWRAS